MRRVFFFGSIRCEMDPVVLFISSYFCQALRYDVHCLRYLYFGSATAVAV